MISGGVAFDSYNVDRGVSGGVIVYQARLANLHKCIRVSLGAQFIRPCSTS